MVKLKEFLFRHSLMQCHHVLTMKKQVENQWINTQSSIELARIGSDRKDLRLKSPPTAQKGKSGFAPSQPNFQPTYQRTTSPVGTSPSQNRVTKDSCRICGSKEHDDARQCDDFRRMTIDARQNACTPTGNRLCRHCLKSSCNAYGSCRLKTQCWKCREEHHGYIGCKSVSPRNSPGGNARSQ